MQASKFVLLGQLVGDDPCMEQLIKLCEIGTLKFKEYSLQQLTGFSEVGK